MKIKNTTTTTKKGNNTMANKLKEGKENANTIKENMFFAAINQKEEISIPSSKEEVVKGRDREFVQYGKDNRFPDYLWSLYEEVPTLAAVINGTADYATGEDVICKINGFEKEINKKGETIEEVMRKCIIDKMIFGGYYLNIIQDKGGKVYEIYHIDYRYIRTDKKNEVFFYSEDWSQKSTGRVQSVIIPKFIQGMIQPTSILFVKGGANREVYTKPIYYPSLLACEIERKINKFHLNSINNGFSASYMINFNNGQPTDEIREEIEKSINKKFAGAENAGRIMLTFNNDRDHSTTILPFDIKDFGEKYTKLASRSKEQISISFGCNLNIFGSTTESLGFSSEEYKSAFLLYNQTRIKPLQREFSIAIDKIFNQGDSIEVVPFNIDFDDSDNNNKEKEVLVENDNNKK